MSDDVSRVTAEILGGLGLSLTQAAKKFPSHRADSPVAASTVYRWITQGVELPDGRLLRLEGVRLSGRWLTSLPALERFMLGQTQGYYSGVAVRESKDE
jgi:hypothetical protein